MNVILCPVCERPGARVYPSSDGTLNTCIACDTCGDFCVSHVVRSILTSDREGPIVQTRRKLARYLYETRNDGGRLVTSQKVTGAEGYARAIELESLARMYEADGSPLDKYEDTIRAFAAKSSAFGEQFELEKDRWLVPTMNDEEARTILFALVNSGYLSAPHRTESGIGGFSLTPEGLKYAAQLGTEAKAGGTSVFVAACFDNDLAKARETISGILTELGYQARQVNREPHNNLIDLEIFRLIRESRFVVADLTCNRPSVYYEVGFAHGLGLEVVLTCREDHFDDYTEELKHVHFDLGHRNILTWAGCDDLAEKLRGHIYQSFGAVAASDSDQARVPSGTQQI